EADLNCALTVAAGHTSVEGCLHAYAGVATCILAVSVRSARLGRVERIGLVAADHAADSGSVVRTAAIPAGKRATDRGSNHVARFCNQRVANGEGVARTPIQMVLVNPRTSVIGRRSRERLRLCIPVLPQLHSLVIPAHLTKGIRDLSATQLQAEGALGRAHVPQR